MPERTIAQVMRYPFVVHLPPDATVRQAAKEMSEKHVAAVIVTEGDNKVDGIFTERDLIDRVAAPGRDMEATKLADVMTPRPVCISPQHTVHQAMVEMGENNLRHLPVIDGGRVVGVVSMRDFVGEEIAELDHEREFRQEIWEHAR